MKQANGKGYEAAVTMGGEGEVRCNGREEPGSSHSGARAEDLATALRRLGLDIDLLANDVSTSISRVNVRPRRVKTMLSKFVVMVAAGILASAVLGSSAKAFDEPIPTKISLLKWGGNPPVGKLYKIVSSTGASFPLPAVGTGSDISGGSLLVNAGSETLSCDLSNTSLWKGLGNPAGSKGYKYVNTAAPVGDPCKLLLVKEKVIKVLAKGVGSIALPGPLGTNPDVEMVLNAGADSYCARATAPHSTEKAGALIKMKDEPAPAGCQQECGNGVREWTEQCDDGNLARLRRKRRCMARRAARAEPRCRQLAA